MLILTRKPGEVIVIGDNVFITVVEIKGNQIRVGIDAPREMRVYRKEIYDQIQAENQAASQSEGVGALDGLADAMAHTKVRSSLGQLTGAKVPQATTVSSVVKGRSKKE